MSTHSEWEFLILKLKVSKLRLPNISVHLNLKKMFCLFHYCFFLHTHKCFMYMVAMYADSHKHVWINKTWIIMFLWWFYVYEDCCDLWTFSGLVNIIFEYFYSVKAFSFHLLFASFVFLTAVFIMCSSPVTGQNGLILVMTTGIMAKILACRIIRIVLFKLQ